MEKRFWKTALICLVLAAVLCFVFEGMRFSALLFACAAAVFAAFAWFEKRGKRTLKRILCTLLALGFAFFSVLEFFVVSEAVKREEALQVDAVIVLGAGVNGERPSQALRTRINAAAAYLADLPEDVPVILSGGKGGGENISEAECIRRELAVLGVDASRLILEDKSTDTRENFANSCAILREMGLELSADTRIAIITNDFHLCRSKLLLKDYAEAQAVGVGAPLPWLHLSINYYVREAFALAELLILGG